MTEDAVKTEVKNQLQKYNLPDAKIAELKDRYLKLKVNTSEDIDNYLACKSAHQEIKAIRISIEKKRVELKATSVAVGKAIDTEAKRLTVGVTEIESHLENQRKVVEDEKKRKQEEAERKVLEEQERAKKEEEDRLERVRLEQEEKEKKLREEQDKLDADRKAVADEKENNRLDKLKFEKEKQDEKDRIARDKKHAEEVEQAKKEAAENAKKEEQERVAKEAKEKEEAQAKAEEERIEADKNASDKDKLQAFAKEIFNVKYPVVKSKTSETKLSKVRGLLTDAFNTLTK